eukprot:2883967-Prymnesium_polylepis.1
MSSSSVSRSACKFSPDSLPCSASIIMRRHRTICSALSLSILGHRSRNSRPTSVRTLTSICGGERRYHAVRILRKAGSVSSSATGVRPRASAGCARNSACSRRGPRTSTAAPRASPL